MTKKRILFGAVDIGYRIKTYSDFIHANYGQLAEAESISKYVLPKSHYSTSYTFEFPINKISSLKMYWKTFWFFIKALFRYDVFHFLSGETILTWKLRKTELIIYKLFRKKVIMHFVGSDIRSEEYLLSKNNQLKKYLLKDKDLVLPPISNTKQLKLIEIALNYSDKIIVSTPDLLKLIPTAIHLPVMLNFDEFYENQINHFKNDSNSSSKIKILHSPSGFGLKGSEYINLVLDEIQQIYPNQIEILLPGKDKNDNIYSLSRYELFEKFSLSDIVIDQMLIGWYGLKSIEALAYGCEVICYIEKDLEKYLPPQCPIISANILNLKELIIISIEKLLKQNNKNQRLQKNKEYIFKHHDVKAYNNNFKQFWL
ncbi:MAG: hypothetical protein LCH32_12965 [Bacteroidetes bacterium]|nr:hypothetical protein [Bacteroidota bacterium]